MKYVVAEGVSFYNGGKVYAPGDEITKSIFKPESAFDDAVAKGQILAAGKEEKADTGKTDEAKKVEAAAEEAEKKEDTADKKAGSKKGGK